jgi:hypothetical protein
MCCRPFVLRLLLAAEAWRDAEDFFAALDRGKSPTQRGHLKWFAGVWGLVPK